MSTEQSSVPPPDAVPPSFSIQPPVSIDDPPPPYPSRERRSRPTRYHRRHRLPASSDSDRGIVSPHLLAQAHSFPRVEDATTEQTPLLSDSPPDSTRRSSGRQRTCSQSSTIISSTSYAPSLAQTVLSLFQSDPADESDVDIYEVLADDGQDPCVIGGRQPRYQHSGAPVESHPRTWFLFSWRWWSLYFRPITRGVYHAAVFHLLVLNFPYALIAWVYLFVFTLVSARSLTSSVPDVSSDQPEMYRRVRHY